MIVSGEAISKSYGTARALDKATVHCGRGKITGLIGTNGAGKTTLFRILTGLIKPDEGKVTIRSSRPKPLGAIIEKPALYGYLNARENLSLFSRIQHVPASRTSADALLEKVGLPADRKDAVRNYSLGMKQRLGIAIALINKPECLILDEPFSGLDPLGVSKVRKLILDLAGEESIATLIASHNVLELSGFCDFLYVLKKGRIIASAPAYQLILQYTDGYMIRGSHMHTSEVLKNHCSLITDDLAEVNCSAGQISGILQALHEEGIRVTTCSPRVNLHRLFQESAE